MRAVIHLAVVFGALVAVCNAQCGPGKSCRTGLAYKKHFDEMNCTAVNSTNDAHCCATNYDCASTERSISMCTYMGVTYEVNARLPADLQAGTPCLSNCTCTANSTGNPSWVCAKRTCPVVTLTPNCTALYRPGECCSYNKTCTKAPREEFRCKIGPQSFRENSTIPTVDPCMRCLCLKGFRNKIEEPFCKKMNCGIELTDYDWYMKRGCAPVYRLGKPLACCPARWQCPHDADVFQDAVVTNKSAPLNPNTTCTFGTRKLTDGQSVLPYYYNLHSRSMESTENCTMVCTCHTTPGLICTVKPKCPLYPSSLSKTQNILPINVDISLNISTVAASTTIVKDDTTPTTTNTPTTTETTHLFHHH